MEGIGGEVDEIEGVQYIQQSAEDGYPPAQSFYAEMYLNGLGVKKNDKTGVKWMTNAAENCNGFSQNALANFYFNENYVKKDIKQAYYWIKLAAYYGFENFDIGLEVVSQEINKKDKKKIDKAVEKFKKKSGCGDQDKPVYVGVG
ncbi:tetratricopeptide repeat protein [Marinicellulosiphila megalodicopiae]|uniref:tetratricopeptide repeat protein n=1 Tax=Marinicellulosiphila megalodicopiae TaxID=2724896 RepID=UPI003BB07571